jgi:hypothetical protein
MPELLRYRTGQEICRGDRVLMDNHSGVIEFTAYDQDHPEQSWYVRECGVGVMINTSEFGSVYTGDIEELEFVARGK